MMGLRKPAVHAVSEMLEAQHKALLAGDLDGLGGMAADLERAFARLERERGDEAEIDLIKEAATRNARLLLAAQSGVATARARLTQARSSTLTTYGADGRSHSEAPVTSRTFMRR